MRWFWIDRFEKMVVGKEATTLKNVTLGEEPLDDYLPGYPHFPHSLMIEGMAQTGGLLIAQIQDFTQRIVLAKVSKAVFNDIARPGDQLRLNAKIMSLHNDGAIIEGTIDVGTKRLAEMELTFAILDESYGESSFFMPGDFCRILRSLCLFDVVMREDGTRVPIPPYMLEAEVLEKPVVSNSP